MATPTLVQIIENNAQYVRDSGYQVEINRSMETVSIQHDTPYDEMSVFLQGHEADNFINEADTLWNDAQHVSLDDCLCSVAKQYIDNIL